VRLCCRRLHALEALVQRFLLINSARVFMETAAIKPQLASCQIFTVHRRIPASTECASWLRKRPQYLHPRRGGLE
jgi:hypothetical protein